jgi:hypothetical protein
MEKGARLGATRKIVQRTGSAGYRRAARRRVWLAPGGGEPRPAGSGVLRYPGFLENRFARRVGRARGCRSRASPTVFSAE